MSFFGRWKNLYLRSEIFGQDPEGRYFAVCLAEALRDSAEFRRLLLPRTGLSEPDIVSVRTETSFRGWGRRRYGDVGFLRSDGKLSALVEIKMEDPPLPRQFQDYVRFCRPERIPLVVISKYRFSEKDEDVLRKYEHTHRLFLGDVAHMLGRMRHLRSPVCRWLLEFIKEENMFYDGNIDPE